MELRAARMLALLIAAGLSGLPAADGHEFRCGSWAETGLDLHPAEEEALVAFRDAIEEDNGLLETCVCLAGALRGGGEEGGRGLQPWAAEMPPTPVAAR